MALSALVPSGTGTIGSGLMALVARDRFDQPALDVDPRSSGPHSRLGERRDPVGRHPPDRTMGVAPYRIRTDGTPRGCPDDANVHPLMRVRLVARLDWNVRTRLPETTY